MFRFKCSTDVQHVNFIDSLPAINEIDMKMKININLASYLLSYTFGGKLYRSLLHVGHSDVDVDEFRHLKPLEGTLK